MPGPLNAKENLIDLDTEYSRVWIFDDYDHKTGEPIRELQINTESNSAMFLERQGLVFEYTKYYRLAEHFNPGFQTALMFGGAAYSYPKDFIENYDSATLDVVEIDPKLTELAREYFELQDNPRLNIIHEDGRTYLNKTEKKYDIIFGDAFTSFYSIPYQLTTIEAVAKTYNSLNEGGVAIINIATAIEGNAGKFLRAELATYQEYFPQTFIFPVSFPNNGDFFQNVILVAIKSETPASLTSDNPEYNKYLSHLWTKEIPKDLPVLTDEHAPVDYYINQAVNEIF